MTRLAAMIAIATGKQKRLCEDFIKEIFRIVAEELVTGENVRIKGLGTFKLVDVEPRKSVNVVTGTDNEIPGHSKIVFVAAKELASFVNTPFEVFEAVEISDDIPTDMLLGDDLPALETSDVSGVAAEKKEKCTESLPTADDGMPYDDAKEDAVAGGVIDELEKKYTDIVEESGQNDESARDVVSEDICEKPEKHRRRRFLWGFIAGFIGAALIDVGVMLWNRYDSVDVHEPVAVSMPDKDVAGFHDKNAFGTMENVIQMEGDRQVLSDTTVDVPTTPSDQMVYDTVTTTRYLTIIAKEHYGNFNLWPIIYEENKAILGHPNRIKPGTRVVVPQLSKYGVDPNNPDDVKRVKQKGLDIYDRFK